ncbi:MAG TPA: hypothetical protein VE961_04745 [Pyrinomonadaceae bacterium]|nr:hypothetical protein [Pyrinomonadaceae bacterium]
MRNIWAILEATCLVIALLNLPVIGDARKTLPAGRWGGQHIRFDALAKGAKIEYDCAHATIDESIILDGNGRFNVSGKHFPERGGPSRQGEPAGYPVTFSGEVRGKTMTLTVRNRSTNEEIGSFTLAHGAAAKLFKCL